MNTTTIIIQIDKPLTEVISRMTDSEFTLLAAPVFAGYRKAQNPVQYIRFAWLGGAAEVDYAGNVERNNLTFYDLVWEQRVNEKLSEIAHGRLSEEGE